MSRIARYFAGIIDNSRAIDAGKRDRSRPWMPPAASAPEDMRELALICARSQDLYDNNDLARSMIDKYVNGVVGYGIYPHCMTESEAFNELVERRFEAWAKNPTPGGDITFYGLQHQVELAKEVRGECFVVVVTPPASANMPVPLWLKVLEADMCDRNLNEPETSRGTKIIQGVEFDRYDRVVAYWFHHYHPGESMGWRPKLNATNTTHIRLPADEVIHVWNKFESRSSATRGLPRMVSVIRKIKAMDSFDRAELTKQELAACYGLAVQGAEESAYNSSPSVDGKLCDSSGRPIDSIYPAMTAYLPPGATIQPIQPPTVTGFAEWMTGKKHGVAAAVGVPYALATGDLTKVNFSSSRYGQGVFTRSVGATQWFGIIPQFCERVWALWFKASYEAGLIQVPTAPVEWTTQPFPSVNPLQDAQADSRNLRLGKTSLSAVIARDGESPRKVFKARKKDNDTLDKLEMKVDSDPRYLTQAGANQPIYDTQASKPGKKKAGGSP